MTTTENQKPRATIRYPFDKRLKIDLWERSGSKGPFLSPTITRTYEDKEGNLKNGGINFSDLPYLLYLIPIAMTKGAQIIAEMKQPEIQDNQESSEDLQEAA